VFNSDDTIVAIATPEGRGGIGVVRLSGPDAAVLAARLLRPAPSVPRHATFCRLADPSGGPVVDQVVATWFVAPHSYTGEDVVEISAHGSPVLLRQIVALAMASGARLAEPGEFTFRAYLRGRLDLPQAEAVADLADAVTPLQARAAMDQLEGTLTGTIGRIDAALFDLSARLEASLDYPEEAFHFGPPAQTAAEISRIRDDLDRLASEGRTGRVIREGRMVVIAGRPNAGKSSLFNALIGASRAIVTEIPGTTRDLLTERVDLEGLAITLVDTAGVRDARDQIEAEGVRRAHDARDVAALTLIVIDGSEPIAADDRALMAASAATPGVIVVSKSDLPRVWAASELGAGHREIIEVSSVTGDGLRRLRERVVAALAGRENLRDPPAISNVRHLALVDVARDAMTSAERALASGATEELVLTDITRARRALEEITGRRTTEDVLGRIFARFCLGK
jgi:tRNA modification GTPase